MAAKFRFICLTPDLVFRARFKPPADQHSFLAGKPRQDPPAGEPAVGPYRFGDQAAQRLPDLTNGQASKPLRSWLSQK